MKLNFGMIGCGHWGQNLLRNFTRLESVDVGMVSELSQKRINYVNHLYPQIETVTDYRRMMDNRSIDAVVIATPASSHHELVKYALESGKHVFVEKPMATKSSEAFELIKLSERAGKILMVGHTFEYNPAVEFLRDYIMNGELGDIYYFYSQRLNLGIVRDDVNVMWNLAPHDLSILMFLLGTQPQDVSTSGVCYLQENLEDVVFMVLSFPNNIKCHIHASWLDPNKVRRLTVVGSKKMVIYDDVSDNKIMIFDKGITLAEKNVNFGEYDTFGRFQVIKRVGDIHIPHIDFVEPLQKECQHFVDCILNGKEPISNGLDGYRVVKILEAAQMSLNKGGEVVDIGNDGVRARTRLEKVEAAGQPMFR